MQCLELIGPSTTDTGLLKLSIWFKRICHTWVRYSWYCRFIDHTYMSDVSADTLVSISKKAPARATTHDQPILGHLKQLLSAQIGWQCTIFSRYFQYIIVNILTSYYDVSHKSKWWVFKFLLKCTFEFVSNELTIKHFIIQ